MGHYRSNRRDLEFVLFELLGLGELLAREPAGLDADTARDLLAEVDRLATEDLAASFEAADREPPVLDRATGTVGLPAALLRSYSAYVEGGWDRLGLPEHLGGPGIPPSLRWACAEMVLGANPAVFMYGSGAGFAAVLHRLGTPDQQRFAELAIERHWGGTMVLTEPDAGSDVGAARTTARLQPDGTWHLTGTKRFITSAEWDWPENVFHLVLARPVGVPGVGGPGTKGLSLFLVSRSHVDLRTGALGGRNGVRVTGLEHKMGLRASATCELAFGEDAPAVATLVGGVHDGIAQMFQIIADARMFVGVKALATLSTGYLTALAHARVRVQGPDLTRAADRSAPRVRILAHPDVRLMLVRQKAWAEGLRALALFTAAAQDRAELARSAGAVDREAEALADLLLPVVKGYGSEKAYELLAQSLQVLGGAGYTCDFPVEQYLRDAKIDTLYEGTTTIQGLDLFLRKVVRDRGRALGGLLEQVRSFVKDEAGNGALAGERERLGAALEDVEAVVSSCATRFGQAVDEGPGDGTYGPSIYAVGLTTTRLLMALGDLVVGWLLLRSAAVALDALPHARPADVAFYRGKVATARWYTAEVLPLLRAARAVAEAPYVELMELDEAAF